MGDAVQMIAGNSGRHVSRGRCLFAAKPARLVVNPGFRPTGKMQHKQGRDGPSVPVMPEVAVHSDGRLRRPAQEAARPATASSAAVRTALETALPARVAHIFYPPPPPPYVCSSTPRLSNSSNPLPPAYLPLHSALVIIEHALSGPRSPSETSPGGLPLLRSAVPVNPAGFRRDGAFSLGTDVPVRRPAYGRGATPALTPGATLEVTHVQP